MGGSSGFVTKLRHLISDSEFQHLISWNSGGDAILVHDSSNLAELALPKYFDHRNFQSFVRQLHLYGFRKVRRANRPMVGDTSRNVVVEFQHASFLRDYPDLMYGIRRHGTEAEKDSMHTSSSQVSQLKARIDFMAQSADHWYHQCQRMAKEIEQVKNQQNSQMQLIQQLQQQLMLQQKLMTPVSPVKPPLIIASSSPMPDQHHGMVPLGSFRAALDSLYYRSDFLSDLEDQ